MTTITTILSTDVISSSRTDINNNFSNLNTDKIETSYLDTDTTLSANSDVKIATQKAVKAYVDSGGNPNASTTARGISEEATAAEIDASTQTGSTGAELFVNPKYLNDCHNIPTVAPSTSGNFMRSNGTDWISEAVTVPFVSQEINIGTNSNNTPDGFAVTSNLTGSVLFLAEKHSAASSNFTIYRLLKDTTSGHYYITHTTTLSTSDANQFWMTADATYLWISANIGAVNSLRRYSATDLSGVTSMTFSGTSRRGNIFSDGTNLWIANGTTDQYDKFTISGTTATNASAPNTYTSSTAGICICDGTSVWIADQIEGTANNATINIRKYPLAGGAATSTKTYIGNGASRVGGYGGGLFIASSTMTGIAYAYQSCSATAIVGAVARLWAISN